MTYEITVTQLENWLWQADVAVRDDAGSILLAGQITVSCETEQEAYDHTEKVFLPDLRANFPRQIGGLVFPWEIQEPEGDPA